MLFLYNYSFAREIGDGSGALGFDRRLTVTHPDGGKTEFYFDATNQRAWKVNPEDWTSDNSNPMVGTPASPVKLMSVESAKKTGLDIPKP